MMMLDHLLRLAFTVLTVSHCVFGLARLISSRHKTGGQRLRGSIRAVTITTNATLTTIGILACVRFARLTKDAFTVEGTLPATPGIAIGSVMDILLDFFCQPDLPRVLYELLSCTIWSLIAIRTPGGWTASATPILYLVSLITTLAAPWTPNPHDGKHPLSGAPSLPACSLSWLDPLIKQAASGPLGSNDAWPRDYRLSAQHALKHCGLQPHAVHQSLSRGLASILWRNFTFEMALSALLGVISIATAIAQPLSAPLSSRDVHSSPCARIILRKSDRGCYRSAHKFLLGRVGN